MAICSALQLVLSSEELPGIGEDFEQLRGRVSSSMADDISSFLLTHMPSVLTDLSLQQAVTGLEPEAFIEWIEALDASELATRAFDYAQRDCEHQGLHALKADSGDSPASWSLENARQDQLELAQRLRENPDELKASVTQTLRRFWREHLQSVYADQAKAMRQVVELVRDHPDLTDLPTLFERMLGRSIEDAPEWERRHPRICLVPFPFMGPYVMSMTMEEPDAMLLLAFDADRALGFLNRTTAGPEISKLKALADETRLKILRFVAANERFGGDIVTHLGISQPGVSRHLRLLTASGLLRVRQEGTSKYYTICGDQLDTIAEDIRRITFASQEKGKDGTS